jgi:LPXTG-motif cell wall-anchored protein
MRHSNRSAGIFKLVAAGAVIAAVSERALRQSPTTDIAELPDERAAVRTSAPEPRGRMVRTSLVALAAALFTFGSVAGATSSEAPSLVLKACDDTVTLPDNGSTAPGADTPQDDAGDGGEGNEPAGPGNSDGTPGGGNDNNGGDNGQNDGDNNGQNDGDNGQNDGDNGQNDGDNGQNDGDNNGGGNNTTNGGENNTDTGKTNGRDTNGNDKDQNGVKGMQALCPAVPVVDDIDDVDDPATDVIDVPGLPETPAAPTVPVAPAAPAAESATPATPAAPAADAVAAPAAPRGPRVLPAVFRAPAVGAEGALATTGSDTTRTLSFAGAFLVLAGAALVGGTRRRQHA